MGSFKSVCIKCRIPLLYEYDDEDKDIGKIKVEKICWNCIDNNKLEIAK